MMDDALLIHPGEILLEEFIKPHGLNANRLACALGVPPNRITAIIKGSRGISGETAVLFGRAFSTTPEFWLDLQSRYDLDLASRNVTAATLRRVDQFARQLMAG